MLKKLVLITFLLPLFAVNCSDDDSNETTGFGECTTERDGWEQCSDNKIQYCHIVTGMDPHFHWGTDCEAQGLTCVNINNQGSAACVDPAQSCTTADERCENNTAYFCVEGSLAIDACGTAATCHDDEGTPHCEEKTDECSGHGHLHDGTCHCDDGYSVDPNDATKCVADEDFETTSCNLFATTATDESVVTAFEDFSQAHADLDTLYKITLPDNQASYLHFPVMETGTYTIMLSEADAFDSFMHRDQTDKTTLSETLTFSCNDQIKDHHRAALDFDGSATDTKVPYIVRFKAIAGGKTLSFAIRMEE